MELILKKTVQNLGFKDDIVKVKNGYGRNFLIPQGYAILATESSKKVLQENIKQKAFKEKKVIESSKERAERILELSIKISSRVSTGNILFGSVTSKDVIDELGKNKIRINKNAIKIPGKKIKKIGSYSATIRLHRELSIELPFEVIAEKRTVSAGKKKTVSIKEIPAPIRKKPEHSDKEIAPIKEETTSDKESVALKNTDEK